MDKTNLITSTSSELLGWQALQQLWRDNSSLVSEWLAHNGGALLMALAVIVVYSALYWLTKTAAAWLITRVFHNRNKEQTLSGLSTTLLRLTFFMLICVSTLALFPAISHYSGSVFRVYALLLLMQIAWVGLHYFISLQVKRWSLDASLELLLTNIVRIILILLGIYLIFAQFGINLLPILGGLGVVGLAVGFAAQDILANFISGITLLLDRPFRIGEWIRTKDHEGQVIGLTLRTTRIRTRNNEHVSIPNKELAGSVVTNLSHGGPLRLQVVVGVAYKTNTEHAREVLLGVLAAHEQVLHNALREPLVWVQELNDSSVDMLMSFWVSNEHIATYPRIAMQIRENAKFALEAAGIEIPFPHLQLHIDGANGLKDVILPMQTQDS